VRILKPSSMVLIRFGIGDPLVAFVFADAGCLYKLPKLELSATALKTVVEEASSRVARWPRPLATSFVC